jgi:putative oxidoreductase
MKTLYPAFLRGRTGAALLLLRLVVGSALVLHGWQKIGNPFHWMDKMPDAPPAFLQGLAVLAEVGGGAALIVGLLAPIAALGVICDMAYALIFVHWPKGDPFVAATASGSSYERALVYLAAAVALFLTGPGRYSLDALLFKRRDLVIQSRNPWVRSTAA